MDHDMDLGPHQHQDSPKRLCNTEDLPDQFDRDDNEWPQPGPDPDMDTENPIGDHRRDESPPVEDGDSVGSDQGDRNPAVSTVFLVFTTNSCFALQGGNMDEEVDPVSLADVNQGISKDLSNPVAPPIAPPAQYESDPTFHPAMLDDLNIMLAFINLIHSATLENSDLDQEIVDRLRNPPEGLPEVESPDLLLAIRVYIAATKASEDTYAAVHEAISDHFPECKFISLDCLKRKIYDLTGITPLVNHMCDNLCIGYTGPFAELMHCPKCGEFRYDKIKYDASHGTTKIACKTFLTIPLGPQLQALWCSKKSAKAMQY